VPGAEYPPPPDADYPPAAPAGFPGDGHYSGDPPISDYRRVSPARPYVEPGPAGEDDDPDGEWDGRAPSPPEGYGEEPGPESFPYGRRPGNDRRRRR
jgi:hypothetical protein